MAEDTKKTVIIDVQTNANDATQQVNGLKSAVNDLEKAGDQMTGGMLNSFKKLATNPYIAAIGVALAAIVGAFKKLKDAIKGSDDAGTAFARLGAILKAPLQLINKLVDSLANGLGKVANAMSDVLLAIMPEKWREQAEAENEVVVATDKLEDAERQYSENHARRESERSELLRIARNEADYTAAERMKALQEVADLEKQDYEEHKRLLEERLRIEEISLRNKQSLSDEEKNRVQDLKNQLISLQTEYNRSLKEVDRISKSVTEKLVEHWVEVEKQHHNARVEIEAYFNDLANVERAKIYSKLAEQADAYWKAMFPTNEAFKNASAEDRKAVLDVFNAIKSGSTDALNTLKFQKDYLDKRWASMTKSQQTLYALINEILGKYSELDTISSQTSQNITDATKKVSEEIQKQSNDTTETAVDNTNKELDAIKERNREIQKGNRDNVRDNDKANDDILKTHDKTIELMDQHLLNYAKRLKGRNRAIAEENARYVALAAGINRDIEDANKKIELAQATIKTYDKEREDLENELQDTIKRISEAKDDETKKGLETLKQSIEESLSTIDDGIKTENEKIDAQQKFIEAKNKEAEDAAYEYQQNKAEKEQYFAEKRQQILDRFDYERGQSLQDQMDNELAILKEAYNNELIALRDYKEKEMAIRKHYEAIQREETIAAGVEALGGAADVARAMSDIYSTQIDTMIAALEEKKEKGLEVNEAEKEALKSTIDQQLAWTQAEIWLNQAQAFGQSALAFAKALADPTIPSTIARIAIAATVAATAVAGVLSAINRSNQAVTQAQQQKAEVDKYATGGYIQGAGTATSDSIPARLSNGEAVINARSTAMYYDLLSAINQRGGGVAFPNAQNTPIIRFANGGVATSTQQIVDAMKIAMQDVQPVVSVKEITRVQNRIKAKETL